MLSETNGSRIIRVLHLDTMIHKGLMIYNNCLYTTYILYTIDNHDHLYYENICPIWFFDILGQHESRYWSLVACPGLRSSPGHIDSQLGDFTSNSFWFRKTRHLPRVEAATSYAATWRFPGEKKHGKSRPDQAINLRMRNPKKTKWGRLDLS